MLCLGGRKLILCGYVPVAEECIGMCIISSARSKCWPFNEVFHSLQIHGFSKTLVRRAQENISCGNCSFADLFYSRFRGLPASSGAQCTEHLSYPGYTQGTKSCIFNKNRSIVFIFPIGYQNTMTIVSNFTENTWFCTLCVSGVRFTGLLTILSANSIRVFIRLMLLIGMGWESLMLNLVEL